MAVYLVVNGRMQPIPFLTDRDALDELEVIRQKTTVVTWDIVHDGDLRMADYEKSSNHSSEPMFSTKTIITFLAIMYLLKLITGG